MPDDPEPEEPAAPPPAAPPSATPAAAPEPPDDGHERVDRGLGDFVRRAVSAGFEAASRGKDDIVRVAAGEVRSWLDHMDLDAEIAKALARMVIEVRTEIRFRPLEDGKMVPEATHEMKVKPASKT